MVVVLGTVGVMVALWMDGGRYVSLNQFDRNLNRTFLLSVVVGLRAGLVASDIEEVALAGIVGVFAWC